MSQDAELTLVVVPLSESFADFWPLLAREAGATLRVAESDATAVQDAALVLVGAGGREGDAAAAVERMAVPDDIPIVVAGAVASHRVAAAVVRAGATDYVALPDDRDVLRELLAASLRRRRAALERVGRAQLEAQAHAFREIVGESASLKSALERAARVLPHGDATVLIAGETGTGKELVARALHYGGPRS